MIGEKKTKKFSRKLEAEKIENNLKRNKKKKK